ncbi:unnamed protein product [Caenorhabditis auriculariae]|uniref:ribonuclease Z n=1 Tax=Caenorhabditis auriculariae TaxID=2777116 RepID=A0A8S1H5Y9_9PELO|nr:unnamed protein product [Caenorhabditis auriculariae]
MQVVSRVLTSFSAKPSAFQFRRIFTQKALKAEDHVEEFYKELNKRIKLQESILRKHSSSHLKAREAKSFSQKQKISFEPPPNSICNIPSQVSIEILGNGTGLMRPCVVLRTPLKTYVFNCPEQSCRFFQQLRVKPANVMDIFVTSSTWDNIAGISSVLLSKESSALPTRIHGATNIKNFLECIRPFQDSDYGSCNYPSQVDEYPYTMEGYEDAGFRVKYIPLSPPYSASTGRESPGDGTRKKACEIDVAFLFNMKEPPRRIDGRRLMEMKIPKGPLIGKLKNGEEVVLDDGRTIRPEDVYVPLEDQTAEKTSLLVLECTTEAHAQSLLENSLLKPYFDKSKILNYIVHLSRENVLQSEVYRKIFASLPNTEHIIVNESTPQVPCVESVYKHTKLLNHIAPSLFLKLHPVDWTGLVTQNNELERRDGKVVRVAPLQRFWMRHGNITNEEPIMADLRDVDFGFDSETKALIEEFHKTEAQIDPTAEYPKISFLGTSSAVPSKYRNVTGYLVEANENSALLVDVGEGTYGQLRVLFGDEQCEKLLTKLNIVLITHAHQDHMNGLYTIIERRLEAFQKLGIPYRPLVLVCNRNVMKPLKTYSIYFIELESLIEVVDISRHPLTPPLSPPIGVPPKKRKMLPSPHLPPTRDILPEMPEIFDAKSWGIHEIKAVQVHHTRMANGFVLGVGGKRVVFSGDTKPCDLLAIEGTNADVLVHEATFEDGHEADALRKKHSTMGQAIYVARKMKAKHVILTHFSARYPKVPVLPGYLDEIGIGVAMDMLRVRFDHLAIIPKLLPIYRKVFEEELFELTMKKEQRNLRLKDEAERNAQRFDRRQIRA